MANKQEFLAMYTPAATQVAQRLNVPVEGVLNHWGLETGWGKSVIPGTNNLGNIKDFSGSGVAATDNMTGSRDKYRAFPTVDDFANSYASLIANNPRYRNALNTETAYDFANGLQQGGYAEDPNFARKVAGMPITALPMARGQMAGGVTPIELIGGREGNLKVQDPSQISPEAVEATANINRMQDFKRTMLPLAMGGMMSGDAGAQRYGQNTFKEAMEGVEPFKMQNGFLTDEGQYITDQDQSGLLKQTIAQMNKDASSQRADRSTNIQGEDRMRDDYYKVIKDADKAIEGYRTLKAMPANAMGDISMVYNYMKTLDPASTVREGEAATVQNAAGVPDRIRNYWNVLQSGQRLTEQQRGEILGIATSLAENAATVMEGQHKHMGDISQRRGFDMENIVPQSHRDLVEMVKKDVANRRSASNNASSAQPTGQVGGLSNPDGGRKSRAGVQSGVPTGIPAGALPHPDPAKKGWYYTVGENDQITEIPPQ